MSVVVKTKALSKCFSSGVFFGRKKIAAVDSLDLEIFEGEIFGFLGPNGAGKTTTLNMLVGVVTPSSGAIELFGERFRPGDIKPLSRIGYLPESGSLPSDLTVGETLDFYARLFGIPSHLCRSRIEALLGMMDFAGEKDIPLAHLSMGQRRIVDLLQALINDPDLILLDEPTVYLDPIILERFRALLQALKAEGKTIIMSSHTLPEIARLSDRIAVIDGGRLRRLARTPDFTREGSIEEEFLRLVRPTHA